MFLILFRLVVDRRRLRRRLRRQLQQLLSTSVDAGNKVELEFKLELESRLEPETQERLLRDFDRFNIRKEKQPDCT